MEEKPTSEDGDGREPAPVGRRSWARRNVRWVLAGVVVVLLLWGAYLAILGHSAYQSDREGLASLELVKADQTPGNVTSGSTERTLRTAERSFQQASSDLSSPLFAPLTVLPVLGRQLQSVRAITAGAAVVSQTGVTFANRVHAVLDEPRNAGPQRVQSVRQLGQLSADAANALAHIDTGPSRALIGPLAAKHDEFVNQLDSVRSRLANAAAVSNAVSGILQGPQTYLVLASNNAEMRAGSGAFLEVGSATAADGSVELGAMTPSGSLALPIGAVTPTGDLKRNWGWLLPGVDWRNLGVTPQFDVTAPMAAQMWQVKTGQHVDGVLSLDVEGLRQLLIATGPVVVGTTTVNADSIDQYLLHDQYEGLTDDATSDLGRTDQLGALAKAVVQKLQDQSLDLNALATSVATATAGRHLLVWSSHPATESAWRKSGAAGLLAYDSVDADLINRGGNKLDQYVAVNVGVSAAPSGTNTAVTMTIHVANKTPPGQSQYIAGPYPGLGTTYGQYVGLLAANLPGDAFDRKASGGGPLAADGPEGPTWLMAVPVSVLAGSSATVTVTYKLPGRHGVMTVEPSARIPAEAWVFGNRAFTDSSPTNLSW
jgi:Protein of unknown function (DUF4012)